jgi:hypothetical protein
VLRFRPVGFRAAVFVRVAGFRAVAFFVRVAGFRAVAFFVRVAGFRAVAFFVRVAGFRAVALFRVALVVVRLVGLLAVAFVRAVAFFGVARAVVRVRPVAVVFFRLAGFRAAGRLAPERFGVPVRAPLRFPRSPALLAFSLTASAASSTVSLATSSTLSTAPSTAACATSVDNTFSPALTMRGLLSVIPILLSLTTSDPDEFDGSIASRRGACPSGHDVKRVGVDASRVRTLPKRRAT